MVLLSGNVENGNGNCWGIKLDEDVPTPYLWFDSAFGTIRGGAARALRWLNKTAASGVNGITAAQYQGNLESNIQDLAKRLENGSYLANEPKRWHNVFA